MRLFTLIGAILALTTVSVAQNTPVSNRLLNLKEEEHHDKHYKRTK